jgi:signal transduction histidine kinase/ligand-binding sensor domain-containing protein
VASAVQTHDGYLWFGTFSGLARFDGERFQVFDSVNTPSLQNRRITSLFEDAKGTLWIGQDTGAITQYRDGRFELFAGSSPLPSERLIGIGTDEKDRLWAMRQNGAVDALEEHQRLPSLIASDRPAVMAWSRSSRGSIWVAENGRAAFLANGALTTITLDAPRRDPYVVGIAAAASGGAWILRDDQIRKWENGRWTEHRGDFPWPDGPLSYSIELRDGTLAVGTIYSGLYLIFGDGRRSVHFDRSNGLPQNWIRFLYEDREGNLWVGAGSAGLVSIHPTAFSVLNAPDQWQGCTVLSVAPARDGALWVGTDGAGLYRHSRGTWAHYGEAEGLSNPYIPAVTETAAGEVWAGNFWWGGPYRLENDRFVRPAHIDDTSSPVLALLAGPESSHVLVGNRDGLLRIESGGATWLVKLNDSSIGDACALVRDRDGVIWCGFRRGGLARIAPDGKVSTLRRPDGLASDGVQSLLLDDDGSLWIATVDNGLSRLKNGRFANIGMAQGLADNVTCKLLDDGRGYFWLSTHHGIQRILKTDLTRCADGVIPSFSSQIYNHSDGLPTIEFTGGVQAAGCKTPDGRLWFASSKGLVNVDPARIETESDPPPVILESLSIDGKRVSVDGGSVRERLAPDHQRLEFRYTALTFVAPDKVRFKYRLEGLDKAWADAGAKRTAFYSQLPAGDYRFRVIACNNDGVWNEAGAALAFTVAPFFWRTWWFAGSSALAALVAVAWIARHFTRRRMQRRMEQLERQRALERERTRIAQDIHDDVGASLTRIAMLSQIAPGARGEPERMAATLTRIGATAGEMTQALDEIVWAIDPRHDTLESLVTYMGKVAQDFLGAANLRCRLDLPVQLPTWSLRAEIRHNLFLAFKEALNNVLRHAHATEVCVALRVHPDSFELLVRDNGRGFDSEQRPQPVGSGRANSGNGLVNIKRRLARIGGRCEIATASGQGTSVSFIVAIPDRNASPRQPPHSGSDRPTSLPPSQSSANSFP